MTMRFNQLITHWNADQAHAVLEFLEELSTMLWNAYGDEILKQHHDEFACPLDHEEQLDLDLDLDDEIPF